MSLFTELFALTKSRRFTMIASSDHDTGLLTLCMMPRVMNETEGHYCKGLTLTAKPEDFDTDFVTLMASYRIKIIPLLDQVKEAMDAIETMARDVQLAGTSNPSAHSSATSVPSTLKPSMNEPAALRERAAAYYAASAGDCDADDEPNLDWMKNRQPELF
ncbi:hypothetical protein GM658_05825 [Pseudoduganella eburnea]|uniref:PRTRC system protein E n=1 Tax=Massilia eburnea TaxID=1776165 RepID=A0A6L6QD62_9BURK|nr:hypothetical protein [Massilia eburnea]MTW10115.1 hypothetical protein [Massilia eburnea]